MKITKDKLMHEIRAYLLITFGLLIYTFAVTAFLAPHRMVGGGVTGISTIIYFLSGEVIPIGYSYLSSTFCWWLLQSRFWDRVLVSRRSMRFS